jgi:hypothetical protein
MSLTCARVFRFTVRVAASRNVSLLASCALGTWLHCIPVLAQPASLGTSATAFEPSAIDLLGPETIDSSSAVEHPLATVVVDGKLRPFVNDLLYRSTAFRRQWQRLSRVSRLSMRIALVHAHDVRDAHAATEVSALPDGSLVAVVRIPGGVRLAELIAHELEHVLERLDGVKVAAQHALGDQSVRRGSGTFETARAVLVGQMVAAEYRPR